MSQRAVIIGAVAAGSKAACRYKRLCQNAEVILIDQDKYISYGGCGIPYYVSGDVSDEKELRSTSFHMVRDEKFFRHDKGVEAMTGTRAFAIDREKKTVRIEKPDGTQADLSYDRLMLATGSRAKKLNIPGMELENVFSVANLEQAMAIKEQITTGRIENAVVIGAGFIGLEMAEALSDMWEIETSVVEYCDQIMPGFVSKNLSQMGQHKMEQNGVTFYLGESVEEIQGQDGRVSAVKTEKRTLEAQLVISAVGIEPNSDLARDAGLEAAPGGFIVVNDRMQTSDPDIYAGGDCVQVANLVTGKPCYYPLGSIANRQGRVVGTNMAGGDARFKGAVGSFAVKLFDGALAGAGLTPETAAREGYDAVGIQVGQFDRAHFYPEKEIIFLELVVDTKTRRVLGIQGFGGEASGMYARVNAIAPLLQYHPSVADISNLELAYSPPFASAMDIVNAVANAAENHLDGYYAPAHMEDFVQCWNNRDCGKYFFLDCRAEADAKSFEEKYPDIWKSIPHEQLHARINEVPRDKTLVLVCNTGVRSYEAQVNLAAHGITDAVSVGTGIAGMKECGMRF
ncbi:MAG: FAD-dependent oxidoreductase [Desulfobacteraceae bacterium]|nr:FAD-dependent oxidoreductase [Desulfobacteraceae bacterium]MCF8094180.1 FAD-dependent oxidoreductase [Desulfobacteraceae bacterium]